jgi:hypothetical protein
MDKSITSVLMSLLWTKPESTSRTARSRFRPLGEMLETRLAPCQMAPALVAPPTPPVASQVAPPAPAPTTDGTTTPDADATPTTPPATPAAPPATTSTTDGTTTDTVEVVDQTNIELDTN